MEENKNQNQEVKVELTPKQIKKREKKLQKKLSKKMIDLKFQPKQNNEEGISHYEALKEKPILFVEDLYKKYPRKKIPTINNISFNVYPGQFHAFIGANGAGKTTSIKSIIGSYAKWSGTILIKGHKNTSVDAKKSLGYIPEAARFPTKMSCFSYLVWMARISGLLKKDAKKFAEEKLRELNMWNLRRKSPNSFSSGQKKKILLAQALINNPDLLVMDEPAANLDPKARLELFETLGKLQKEGKAIFISSHVLSEMDKYANAATILDGGKIVFTGTTKEMYQKYANRKLSIKVDKDKTFKKYLEDEKIPFEYDSLLGNFIVDFQSKKSENDCFDWIRKNEIGLLKFAEVGNTLDDIYRKLITKGSVDTMTEAQEKKEKLKKEKKKKKKNKK